MGDLSVVNIDSTEIHTYIFLRDWDLALKRIFSHPNEVKSYDIFGSLPLHIACQISTIPINIIDALISSYPSSVKEVDKQWGRIPLHYAVKCIPPNLDVISLLLSNYPLGASTMDRNYDTPIYYHLWYSRPHSLDVVKLLIHAYPESVSIEDGFSGLPLHRVVELGNEDIAMYLVE